MKVRYKIVKVDESQKEFMAKYKASACTYCDYVEAFYCTFSKKCPAGEDEYLEKINKYN